MLDMKTLPRTRHLVTTLLLATLAPAAACGNATTSGTTESASSSTGGPGTGGAGTGGAGSGGAGMGGAGTGGAAPMPTQVNLAGGDACLDLATGKIAVGNPCAGDLVFLQGANVDLESNGAAGMVFCPKPGTFKSLAAIPKDYASCAWDSYVEGLNDLTGTGYVLRDAAAAHHYRFWIVSDMGSKIAFELDAID